MDRESETHPNYRDLPPAVRMEDTGTMQETRLAFEPSAPPDPNADDFFLVRPRD